jgi:tetratricopeptide (TPR) repeat protein
MEIHERLARTGPANAGWQRDLSASHDNTGDILRAQGDLEGALKAYRAGMEIRERLARADPDNAGWLRDLVVSHTKLYDVATAEGDEALARWHLAPCVRVMHSIQRSGMFLDAELSRLLAQLEAMGISENDASDTPPPSRTTRGLANPAPRATAPTPPSPVAMPPTAPLDRNSPAARAARLMIEYEQALVQWEALPWLQRLRTKKPEPPQGI